MNSLNHALKSFKHQRTVWLAVLCVGVGPAIMAAPPADAPAAPAAPDPVPVSVFIQPAGPKEGCDPFYPTSSRPYPAVETTVAKTSDLSSLAMQGISGSSEHRLVIINHVTFAVGDVAEIRVPQGRVQLHCLEINADTAVVEVNGHRQTLRYEDKP